MAQDSVCDVLVIGRACVDYIAVVEHFPEEDSKIMLSERLKEGGGQGTNTACCCARLGATVRYVGALGDDDEGRFCLRRLDDFGVDTSGVRRLEGAHTPVAYIMVTRSSGKRTIIYEPSPLSAVVLDETLEALIESARVVLLDPSVTHLASGIKALKPRGAIVYDCERWKDGMADMMSLADYFIPAYPFLSDPVLALGGVTIEQRMRNLAAQVAGRLIVTHGDAGAYYLHDEGLYQVRPPDAVIRDTTGAGDNFHAAFAAALARNFDIHAAVRFAVAVATLSCRALGGRAGLPDFEEARKAMVRLESLRLV
jgi:sugar/nucleoside kinase (ribokinase family)